MYTKYIKYKLDLYQNDRLEDDCSNPENHILTTSDFP